MRFEPGQTIDGYEITSVLGVGGMSEAYLARDGRAGGSVVLKLPHPQLLGDPSAFTRFEREIEIGRRLVHPNVQRVLGTGRIPGTIAPYIVLEYVEGESFRQYLTEHKPLPIDRAIDFANQLAQALGYCHQQGVVHRDLKPENVLITSDGVLKLMDFGIALLEGAKRVTWGSFSPAVGTPDYMAPEQVRGERGDERTDVYSIGVILFEMLAGDVPFHGDNSLAIMSQRVNQDAPRVDSLRPEVPESLAAIVYRALMRNPVQRYPSMDTLSYDLTHLDQVDRSIFAAEPQGVTGLPSAAKTWLAIGLVIGGLILLGVLAQLLHHAPPVH
jgi:serine/threonine-protein kinase